MKNYYKIKISIHIVLLSLFVCSNTSVNSQTRLTNKHAISFGTGLISTAGMNYYSNLMDNEDFMAEVDGGIHFKYEHHLSEKFSLGISFGYVQVRGSWKGTGPINYYYTWGRVPDPNPGSFSLNSYSFVGRFNWSLVKKEKLDIYVGAGAGYRADSYTENIIDKEEYGVNMNELGPPVSIEASFGLRYFLTPNFGFYSEIGLAKSFFQLGIVVEL